MARGLGDVYKRQVIYNGFSEEEVQTLSVMAGKVEKNLWEAIKNEEQK